MSGLYVLLQGATQKVWGWESYHSQETGEWLITTFWGHVGLTMQALQKNQRVFKNHAAAYRYVKDKVDEKERKGYKKIENALYFEAVRTLHDLIDAASGAAGIKAAVSTCPLCGKVFEATPRSNSLVDKLSAHYAARASRDLHMESCRDRRANRENPHL